MLGMGVAHSYGLDLRCRARIRITDEGKDVESCRNGAGVHLNRYI